ncbi:MAG: hypothetical protein VWZ99_04280 [Aquiluna sp.]
MTQQPEAAAAPQSAPAPVVQSPAEAATQIVGEALEALGAFLQVEIVPVGTPVENAAIGASGDDSVIVEFDPMGSPEAVEASNKLIAATGAIVGVAAAAGAAAAAAAAAGAAGAAGAASSAGAAAGSASSAGAAASPNANTGAEMNEDALDALAVAEFEVDAFQGVEPEWGDKLAFFALPLVNFLDTPTRLWTKAVARVSPFVSKLLSDGAYLRAMFGSLSIFPSILGVGLAVSSLYINDGSLLHPPVALFLALTVLGIFDAFAGSIAVLVFVLGSLPLVDFSKVTDLRMLAGIIVAGFGPIVLARSVRNFRRRAPVDFEGVLARIGDILFASLMGGWVAGLIVRALPALTGLTLPAANYVATFQFVATIAIGLRILFEELAARYYPQRMDILAPDSLPEPPRVQQIIVQVLRYFFYVFIASAFMGFGPIVWLASALFLLPTIIGFFSHKLPNSRMIWHVLPVGLPGLAMILGLEILLENSLGELLGDHPDFSVIFILSLLSLILVVSLVGMIGRAGRPGEIRWIERPRLRWLYRAGSAATLLLLVQFTSML